MWVQVLGLCHMLEQEGWSCLNTEGVGRPQAGTAADTMSATRVVNCISCGGSSVCLCWQGGVITVTRGLACDNHLRACSPIRLCRSLDNNCNIKV